jgi:hypothetical protein
MVGDDSKQNKDLANPEARIVENNVKGFVVDQGVLTWRALLLTFTFCITYLI